MSDYEFKSSVTVMKGHDRFYGEKTARVVQDNDKEYSLILFRTEGPIPTISTVTVTTAEMKKFCEDTLAHISANTKITERTVVFPTPPTCPICGHNITVTTKDVPRPVDWSDKRNTAVGSIRVNCAYCNKGLVTAVTYEDTITYSDIFQYAVHNFQVAMIKKDKE